MGENKEFETLRQEIIQNQSRRLTLASGSIIMVTAILGWVISSPDAWPGGIISSLLLAVLIAPCCLTTMYARANARISTYIEVFHEDGPPGMGWEGRIRQYHADFGWFDLNKALSLLYLGIGIVSVVIPRSVCTKTMESWYLLSVTIIVFFVVLIFMAFYSYPKERCIRNWKEIKEREESENDPK